MTFAQSRAARRARRTPSFRLLGGSSRRTFEPLSQFRIALDMEVDRRTKDLQADKDREHSLVEMLQRSLLCPDTDYCDETLTQCWTMRGS